MNQKEFITAVEATGLTFDVALSHIKKQIKAIDARKVYAQSDAYKLKQAERRAREKEELAAFREWKAKKG